jgi:hypothetical protein
VTWAIVTDAVRPTGETIHRVGGNVIDPASALAICQYPREQGFYLFYCDADWQPVTDTWHQTLEGARSQAAFEYQGIESHWQSPS